MALALTRSIEHKAEDISVEYRLISLIERPVKSLNGVKGNGCVNGSRIQERAVSMDPEYKNDPRRREITNDYSVYR